MKKIIPFILFLPLLFFSIYLGYSQLKNKQAKTQTSSSIKNNTDANSETKESVGATANNPTVTSPIATPTSSPAMVSQINLIISSPESGITVDGTSITVRGTTKPKIDVVVNDQEIVSGSDGSFTVLVALDEGENYISIVAYDEEGNVAEREILITRSTSGI